MARAPEDLRREVATIATDPHRYLFGDRIEPEDATLASRGQGRGVSWYDDLERDGQVFAVLQKRRAALIGRRWEVEPADESPAARRAAELVRAQLASLGLEQLVEDLLGALLRGVAIVEILWGATAEGVAPVAARARDPRRFTFRAGGDDGEPELRLLTRAQPLDGEAVPPMRFVVHRYGGRYGNPWGLGLGHRLFWPVWFKRQGVGFWLAALEKFGAPTALGRYAPGTPESEQKRLLEALRAIATDAGVVVPEGMQIELLEAQRSGAFDSYERLAAYMDTEIARIVLGETLTTAVGESGSRALGDVHNEVRLELTRADADQLSRTLNGSLVRWIVGLNLPSAPPPRLWWDVSEPEDLAQLAARDEALARIGYRPTLARVTEVYGEGYEPVPAQPSGTDLQRLFAEAAAAPAARPTGGRKQADLERKEVPKSGLSPAAGGVGAAGAGGLSTALPGADFEERNDPPRDAADTLADQLAALLAEREDPLTRALEALVARAQSLEEVRDGLVALLPDATDARLAELLAQALIVASLQGRADLADGL
jgi:phage gp29-like protein